MFGSCPHHLDSYLLRNGGQQDRRAIFIDRDDCLIRDVPRNADPDRVELAPMIGDLLLWFQRLEYWLVIVTNAGAALATGAVTEPQYEAVNERMLEMFHARFGLHFDALYFCPHYDVRSEDSSPLLPWNVDQCHCRKPRPGMILAGARDMGLDLSQSWMIGDKESDMQAGRAAGCKTMLIDHRLKAGT